MNESKAALVGQKVADARKQAGMNQKTFATRMGVSERTVGNWETGKHLPFKWLRELEIALEKPAGFFLDVGDMLPAAPFAAPADLHRIADELANIRLLLERFLDR